MYYFIYIQSGTMENMYTDQVAYLTSHGLKGGA